MQPLTPREALAGIALLAMDSDGVLSGEEDEQLRDLLLMHGAFRGASERDVSDVLVAVERRARKAGLDAFLEDARVVLSEDDRASAFAIAADIVCSDETLAEDEARFLGRVQRGLDLDASVTDLVLEELGVTRGA